MKIPEINGIIDRRILINYTADHDVVKRILPRQFYPKIYKGKAIVGICLIRLKKIRPKGLPSFIGISSENAAHRIAIEWNENGVTKEGVYIPRRDTSIRLNSIIGGRFFPGIHHISKFNVSEFNNKYCIELQNNDGTYLAIDAAETDTFNQSSVFETLDVCSKFFEKGSLGYSPNGKNFDGLLLETKEWNVKPLNVNNVVSSYFENEDIFPKGSIQFDNALLMTNIKHSWKSADCV